MIDEPSWNDDTLTDQDERCALCKEVWPRVDMEQIGVDDPKNVQWICPVCVEGEGERC